MKKQQKALDGAFNVKDLVVVIDDIVDNFTDDTVIYENSIGMIVAKKEGNNIIQTLYSVLVGSNVVKLYDDEIKSL